MTKIFKAILFAAALLSIIAIGVAQQPAAKFRELQRRDIPGTGRVGVTTVAEIPPGVLSARHSHAGEDFGYLIEGTTELYVDGDHP